MTHCYRCYYPSISDEVDCAAEVCELMSMADGDRQEVWKHRPCDRKAGNARLDAPAIRAEDGYLRTSELLPND